MRTLNTGWGISQASEGYKDVFQARCLQLPRAKKKHDKTWHKNSRTYTQHSKNHIKKSATAFLHSTVADKKSIFLVKTPFLDIDLEFKFKPLRNDSMVAWWPWKKLSLEVPTLAKASSRQISYPSSSMRSGTWPRQHHNKYVSSTVRGPCLIVNQPRDLQPFEGDTCVNWCCWHGHKIEETSRISPDTK